MSKEIPIRIVNLFDYNKILNQMTACIRPGVTYVLRGTEKLGNHATRQFVGFVNHKLQENQSPYRLVVDGEKLPIRYEWDYVPVEGDLFMESEKEKWEEHRNAEST